MSQTISFNENIPTYPEASSPFNYDLYSTPYRFSANNMNSILENWMPNYQFCRDDTGYCIAKGTKKLTNFWVIPITEHCYHSRSKSEYILSLLFINENTEKELQTSLTELKRKGWLMKHLGACSGFYMDSSAVCTISNIIQLLCAHLRTVEIKDHYKYDGFSPDYDFYSKRGAVITTELFLAYAQEPDTNTQLMESAKLVDETILSCLRREKMLSLLAVRVLAPYATQLSIEKKIDLFLLNIVGQSGTRKTTLCEQLFCGGEKTDISFSLSTTKAFEKKMKQNSDRVVIFDDAHPVTGTAKKRDFENKLELLCRTAGDAGTIRETANEMFATSDIHCCIPVLTGEMDISRNPSTLARMYTVRLARNEMDTDKLAVFYDNIASSEYFFDCCLSWSMVQESWINTLKGWFDDASQRYGKILNYGLTRYAESAALVEVGVLIYLSFMRDISYYDDAQYEKELTAFRVYHDEFLQERELHASPLGILKKIFTVQAELQSQGEARIDELDSLGNAKIIIDKSHDVIGFNYLNTTLYIRKDFIPQLIKKADEYGIDVPNITMHDFRKYLDECGMIKSHGKNRALTKQNQFQGHRESCCVIDYQSIKKLLEGNKND